MLACHDLDLGLVDVGPLEERVFPDAFVAAVLVVLPGYEGSTDILSAAKDESGFGFCSVILSVTQRIRSDAFLKHC